MSKLMCDVISAEYSKNDFKNTHLTIDNPMDALLIVGNI